MALRGQRDLGSGVEVAPDDDAAHSRKRAHRIVRVTVIVAVLLTALALALP